MTLATEAVCLFILRFPALSDMYFSLTLEFSHISRAGVSQSVFRVGYGLDGPRFESLYGQEFYSSSRTSGWTLEAHSATCSMYIGVYSQGWRGRGVINSHLHLVSKLSTSGALTSRLLYTVMEWTRKTRRFLRINLVIFWVTLKTGGLTRCLLISVNCVCWQRGQSIARRLSPVRKNASKIRKRLPLLLKTLN
jgi:hypothetical protein